MTIRLGAYQGIRGIRYEFMAAHMPEQTKRLEEAGEMDAYLDRVAQEYTDMVTRIQNEWDQSQEARELKAAGYGHWLKRLSQVKAQAEETAMREVIEAV